MSLTCLSRTLDPKDYHHLTNELRVVDHYAKALEGQHEHRRWEYALALHAVGRWKAAAARKFEPPIYDVGGAGTPFHEMLKAWTWVETIVIDPAAGSGTLEDWMHGGNALADVVTCISVIEHIADLDRFLYHLSCLVAPGGLLVLTMDYWQRCGPDSAHFHDMRKRIFCPKTYQALRGCLETTLHCKAFGGVDPSWHGAHVYDYSFASLVMEKRR